MPLHDRYVLKEWLKIFGLTLAACVGLLVVQQIFTELRDLVDDQASTRQILAYYALVLPTHLPLVLPISLLLSLLYTLGNLHRNHELTALRVAGLGWWRITRTLWAAGALLSGATLALNASVIPWAVEEARSLRENLEFAKQARTKDASEVGRVFNLGFDNQRAQRLWLFNRFSAFTNTGYGVTVHEMDQQRRERRRIQATEARFDAKTGVWTLLHGRELLFDVSTGDVLSTPPFEKIELFERGDAPLTMLTLAKRAKDLSLAELTWILERYSIEENPRLVVHAVRWHTLIAGTLGCLVVVGLAIPFAVSGVRVNPAVGVSKSLGLFLVYWLILTFASLAGERSYVAPWLAGWLPNLGMLLLSTGLFLRLR